MMKAGLQLKLGQSLTLTPQLRQAIRLLQLSSIELQTEINLALESNPLLERPEDADDLDAIDDPELDPPESDKAEDDQDEDDEVVIREEVPAAAEEAVYEAEAFDWDEGAFKPTASADYEDSREAQQVAEEDLCDHLHWQLHLTPMSDRDRAIATTLIDALDDSGYLQETAEAIAEALLPEHVDVEEDEIEAVRHLLQRFDPLGVASRTLAENLLVQLSCLQPAPDNLHIAQKIVKEFLDDLARFGAQRLADRLSLSPQEIDGAVELIRSLDPRPGAAYSGRAAEYVAPDAYAHRRRGRWEVRLASGSTPQLGVNRYYESLIQTASRDDAGYLRGQLQEARWLIRSLETRADTLLRVTSAIVSRQEGFLDHGPEAMRPLVLREIADEVGLHESTVSRVTTRKYLHTPRGTFELKHFFSSSLATVDGGTASSTAIQAMIRRLIESEDPRKPLSDSRLAAELKRQGVTVARRTVAKYREAMNITSSNERQRLS